MLATATHAVSARLLNAVQSEYREMPGMCLTRPQFRRLWHLDEAECELTIRMLLAERFLHEDRDGLLHRKDDGTA